MLFVLLGIAFVCHHEHSLILTLPFLFCLFFWLQGSDSEMNTTYSLSEGVYANAKVTDPSKVLLWLGVSVHKKPSSNCLSFSCVLMTKCLLLFVDYVRVVCEVCVVSVIV